MNSRLSNSYRLPRTIIWVFLGILIPILHSSAQEQQGKAASRESIKPLIAPRLSLSEAAIRAELFLAAEKPDKLFFIRAVILESKSKDDGPVETYYRAEYDLSRDFNLSGGIASGVNRYIKITLDGETSFVEEHWVRPDNSTPGK